MQFICAIYGWNNASTNQPNVANVRLRCRVVRTNVFYAHFRVVSVICVCQQNVCVRVCSCAFMTAIVAGRTVWSKCSVRAPAPRTTVLNQHRRCVSLCRRTMLCSRNGLSGSEPTRRVVDEQFHPTINRNAFSTITGIQPIIIRKMYTDLLSLARSNERSGFQCAITTTTTADM